MLSYRTGKAVPAILSSTIDLASLIASAPGPRGSYFDTIGSKLKLEKRTEEAPMRRTGSPACRLGAPDRLRPKAEAPAPRLRGPITGYKGKPASRSLIMVLVAAPSRCLSASAV